MLNSSQPLRVIIIDDHLIIRVGLQQLLERESDIVVVGECDNGSEVLQLVEKTNPDVILLDMSLPDFTGIEVTQQLQRIGYAHHVLIFTACDDEDAIAEILMLGIGGYLTKDEAIGRIVEAIRGVAQQKTGWLSRSVGAMLLTQHCTQSHDPSLHAPSNQLPFSQHLSTRELEVLRELALGHDNQQIALTLSMAVGTVKNHITAIYGRIGVRSRAEAVAWTWQNKLITYTST